MEGATHEQLGCSYIDWYIKYGGSKYKFFCLQNNMVKEIKHKIKFGTIQVPFSNTNAEKLQH